jgi:hypothetical protein
MPNIERIIIASAPFQEFIMTTRRVYRWENHTETLKYLSHLPCIVGNRSVAAWHGRTDENKQLDSC